MTLLDVRNQLVSLLIDQETITAEDFDAIEIDGDLESKRSAVIAAACEDLVTMGLLRALGGDTWILTAPIGAIRNDISVSLPVANGIAETINTFLDANELEGERVDPLNVNESHIIGLLEVLGDILSIDPPGPPSP